MAHAPFSFPDRDPLGDKMAARKKSGGQRRPNKGSSKAPRKTGGGKALGKKRSQKTGPGKARAPKKAMTKVEAVTRTAGSLWSKVLEEAGKGVVTAKQKGLIRLNSFLATCGLGSRRGCEELIVQGRIMVNGKPVTELGTKVDPLRDIVSIDGEKLRPEKPIYVLFHKPKGIVCTNAAHEQKKRVIDLLVGLKGRVFSIGRLDLDSEGLLLMTNDGAFAERMLHPRFGVPKTYQVTLRGRIEGEKVEKARGGVWLAEGKTKGIRIRIRRRTKDRSYLEVELREGRNREIRRIFARLGFPVLKLARVKIGPLGIKGVGKGKWRFLKKPEVEALLRAASFGEEGGEERSTSKRTSKGPKEKPEEKSKGKVSPTAKKATHRKRSVKKGIRSTEKPAHRKTGGKIVRKAPKGKRRSR
jgi:pseudouridine synthase